MAEKKTFKNPRYTTFAEGPGGEWDRIYISDAEKGDPHYFLFSDWDVEIHVTRKPPVVEAGKWMTYSPSRDPDDNEVVYVLAVHGPSAWVSDDPENRDSENSQPWTVPVDRLS